jgi:transcriptional regulator with XRE-family HTH domain
MPIREGTIRLGDADARRLAHSMATELRASRLSLGLSQRSVAAAAGTSRGRLGRIERGELRRPPLDVICRIARALGLSVSMKLFPAGSPVRDAGQLALMSRVEPFVAQPLRMRREVVLPGHGELRAWDAAILDDGGVAFLDAEARLGDLQALNRRLEVKLRDDPRGTIMILVVARTRHNLEVLRDHRETLRPLLPLDGAAIARALRAGRLPPASGLLVV